MISPQGFPGRDKNAIEQMAPILNHLNLLDDDSFEQVQTLIERAELASHTAYDATAVTLANAKTVAAKLASDSKLDATKILTAATNQPAQNAVDAICLALYESSVTEARNIAFANAGKLAATLTAKFDQLRAEFDALVPELKGVRSDRQAIDSGKIAGWKRFRELVDVCDDLRAIAKLARANTLVATVRTPGEWGEHWEFRHAKDRMQTLGSDEFGVFAEIMRREPYVPASRDEALATAEAWTKGLVSA
ncbi:hypothetical protein [Gordonia sp. ABSL49_1]|uniref:hypothetical protein n=1 Tax=Gordonia sp. ABSL49_1 TaxID=2920941 RepID=UPI001F0F9896|nr:hypothetical protein [Gordonia sp. ABSL49_1]MCH5644153.1 hypothetical protein [Gordonia sp. ABSL49_1]